MKIVNYIIFIIMIFNSCKVVKEKAQVTIIDYERMKCNGVCPVFTLKIEENGNAYYYGEMNVDRLDVYKSKLNKDQFEKIISEFENVDFFSLANSYKSLMMDLQTKYIIYRNNEKEKRIKIYDKAPKILNSLILN